MSIKFIKYALEWAIFFFFFIDILSKYEEEKITHINQCLTYG